MAALLKQRSLHIVWCIWFALLMGIPYCTATDPASGPVSLAPLYAWVACGVVAGLWLGSHPSICDRCLANQRLVRLVALIGIVLSAVWAAVCCLDALCCLLYIMPAPDDGEASPWLACLAELRIGLRSVLRFDAPLAFCCAFLCGGCAWPVFVIGDSHVTAPSPCQSRFIAPLLACALGALQPLAWMLLLPHSPFPQPIANIDPVSAATMWNIETLGVSVACVPLPALLMLVFSLCATGALRRNASHGVRGLGCIAALCVGALAFRVVSRAAPSLFATQPWQAQAALALYAVMFFIWLAVMQHTKHETLQDMTCHQKNAPLTPETLLATIEAGDLSYLKQRGLTEREISVLCAYIRGLTAAQTGEILGLAEPTVREYRRRCRVKLNVERFDDAPKLLPSLHSDADRSPHPAYRFLSSLAPYTLVVAAALVLFPCSESVRTWSDVWSVPFGIGVGLAIAWLVDRARSARAAKTAVVLVAFAACGLVAGACLLGFLRTGMVLDIGEGAIRKVLNLAATALFTACLAILSRQTNAPAAPSQREQYRSIIYALLVCLASMCARTGGGFWAATLLVASTVAAAVTCAARATAPHRRPAHAAQSTRVPGAPRQPFEPGTCEPPAPCTSLPQLAICALLAWAYSETWRAQAYASFASVAQWESCALLATVTVHYWKAGTVNRRTLASMVGTGGFSGLVGGPGYALTAYGLLLVLSQTDSRGANPSHSETSAHTTLPWHHPAIAATCGLLCGTLVTNAVWYPLANGANLLWAGGPDAYMTVAYGAVALAYALGTASYIRWIQRHPDRSTR